MTTHTIDLIPEETRRERAVFRRTVCWLAIAAAVTVAAEETVAEGDNVWVHSLRQD